MAGRDTRVTVGAVPDLPVYGTASDGVVATDSAEWQIALARSPSDPADVTDSASRVATSARTVADSAGATDAVSAVLNSTTGWGASWGAAWGG